jgi:diphosphomevalonate decarboxylase
MEKYIQEAAKLKNFELKKSISITCESPSNIALIKYWGKYGEQLPQNPSLSFSLKNSRTETKIDFRKSDSEQGKIEYYFENEHNKIFEDRIVEYLKMVSVYQPFIKKLDMNVQSRNTFPHSAGIASSASSFSALAICLCNIEKTLFSTLQNEDDFYKKASFLARLGSGSASRSIYRGAVLWGITDLVKNSSDEVAIPINQNVHNIFKSYYDAILVVSSEKKAVSSSAGHALMQNHPFANARYKQANINLEKLLLALKSGGEKLFAEIVENEAMSLHALMMSSNPPLSLMKPNTLTIISKLKEFRKRFELNFAYTLDAGPNIHVLYPQKIRNKMKQFIEKKLIPFCEDRKWIDDKFLDKPETKIVIENEI